MRFLRKFFVLLTVGIGLFSVTRGNGQEKTPLDNTARLLQACEAGDVAEVNRLLSAGADPNATDSNNRTALIIAAGYEDTTVVAQGKSSQAIVGALLNRSAKVNIISHFSETALMQAIAKNNDAAVKLLLDKGAIVHAQVVDENTVVVSAGDLKSKPLPQLRLRVEEKSSKGEWFAADDQTIGGLIGWTRPTDAHYRNMLALLKAAGRRIQR